LITIGLSHYCEKARWALDRAGVGYVERAYPPILHYAATLRFRQRSTPILETPHGVLRDSTSIVRHADTFLAEPGRLFPSDPTELGEVERLVRLFDERLGPATRRIAYFYLLDDRAVFARTALARSGAIERAVFRASRPLVAQTIRVGLRIDREGAQKSEERLEGVFDEADRQLVQGGPYLLGSRITAADLTLAALAAPLLIPPRYPWPLPELEQTPSAFRAIAERYRRRPAGAFALRLYAEQRSVVIPKAMS
jgi:glutathione S-transferase